MEHAPGHGDGVSQNPVCQPDPSEGVDAAGAEGEVDAPSADEAMDAGIGASFEECDTPPPPAEKHSQKSTGEPGTDNDNLAWSTDGHAAS